MSKTGSPNGPNGPDDLDAAFSEIVAGLRAEGIGEETEFGKRTRDRRGKDRRTDDASGSADTGADEVTEPDGADAPGTGDDREASEIADTGDEWDEPDAAADGPGGRDVAGPRAGGTATSDWRSSDTDWDSTMLSDEDPTAGLDEDEHFVPPEPPPVRKPAHGTVVAWLFLAAGVLMLIAPGLVGLAPAVSLPFGILSLAAGLGLLLLRIKDGPPPGSDPDNGAQV
ncbi:hypothetical protein [Haloechinothrix sp. LS1_15]|uniref:hypothetical protein n=1 Tax=Haloechinothrix sp. LS1_15 TaxID=2652248 RepID=UPI002943FBA9|nr:hypothetical protein [Haloechinothrix sp. LS1_15]MDV6013446.1 hypothetical protein [Haloechinothrix sp. LS1_15]